MKRLAIASALVALVTAAPAFAVAAIPEPSGFVQLAAGLFVLGGVVLFTRKRVFRNDAE
jgi:hypothetical protein